ncbi:hypothetical protein TrVGV298_003702 [Trichoderma virens]|nr:hypothetical protein TrVGV298_003702 [Trichoderma virens]
MPVFIGRRKKLYKRLKDAYMASYNTWNDEALAAWPYIVEHASLAPSTIGKITNHSITRNMTNNRVTWAHVVALRIIYKGFLFKSRKVMRLIRARYPRANFSTNAYNEEYTRPHKIEEEENAPEKTVQKNNSCAAHDHRDEMNDAIGKVAPIAPQVVNETMSRFLNEREKSQPVEEVDAPYFARIEPKTVVLFKVEEENEPAIREDESHKPLIPTSLNKRKRAIPENANGKGNTEPKRVRKPPTRKQKKDKPYAAADNAPNLPVIPEETPATLEVAGGSSDRIVGSQDINLDWLTEILGNHGNSLSEYTKAVEQNTRAVEKNTELLQRLTEQLLSSRRKRSS